MLHYTFEPSEMDDFASPPRRSNTLPRNFRTTHWSVILKAGEVSSATRPALETLCSIYWYPLYGFVRGQGYREDEAKDLTQEFFAHLLSSDSLQNVSPDKGRFRSFLLAALKNFLASARRDSRRLKRGGGTTIISWDGLEPEQQYALDPGDPAATEKWFDLRWAQTVVKTALRRLGEEMEDDGLRTRFDVLKAFLQGDGAGVSYAEAARLAGLSEPATKTAIFRMRRRYGELIREEVAATVGSEDDVETEIQHLIAALAA